MKAFLAKFFWGLVGNADDQVSTGGVCATAIVLVWLAMYVWCQLHDQALKVSPLDLTVLAGALYAIPKVRR